MNLGTLEISGTMIGRVTRTIPSACATNDFKNLQATRKYYDELSADDQRNLDRQMANVVYEDALNLSHAAISLHAPGPGRARALKVIAGGLAWRTMTKLRSPTHHEDVGDIMKKRRHRLGDHTALDSYAKHHSQRYRLQSRE